MTTQRKQLQSEKAQERTFVDKSSEQWPAEADRPYVVRYQDAQDSNIEWEDLPGLPFLYVKATIGPYNSNVRMHIYGTEWDVSKTHDGIKDLLGWKSDPSEIALYERPDPNLPVLKLVGVYPVVDGFAQLKLEEVLDKAQTADKALHVFPGGRFNKLFGFGWPATRALE